MREVTFEEIDREDAMMCRLRIYPRREYYHATSSIYIDRIMKEGICKRSISGVATVYYGQLKPELANSSVEDAIFISTYPEISWADLVCEKYGGSRIFFIIAGSDIIKAGGSAYPDYAMLQPLDRRGRIVASDVKDMMILGCDCIKANKYKFF